MHTMINASRAKSLMLLSLTLLAFTAKMTSARSLFLRQDAAEDENGYDTLIEEYFDYTNAFLAGFKSNEIIPSATNCTKYLEGSIDQMNTTVQSWQDDSTKDKIYNLTHWTSYSLAPSSRYCVTSGLELYVWGLNKSQQFESFSDVFAAWLQNLLGNVLTFNQLYAKIQESQAAGNNKEIWYYYGRFATLFINFEPVANDNVDDLDGFEVRLLSLGAAGAHGVRSSSVNSHPSPSPRVGGLVTNVYSFSNGLINASLGDASPNAEICQTNITRIVGYSQSFVEEVKNATEEALADAAVSFENILASVYPITYSCYESAFEYAATADYYLETFNDFQKVTYNLIHQLGNIYDTFYYLTQHQRKGSQLDTYTEREQANWWFKLGIYYGTAFNLIFYTPSEIDPYDPLSDYTGLQNEGEEEEIVEEGEDAQEIEA